MSNIISFFSQRLLHTFILISISHVIIGQTWDHTFETTGGYTSSAAECTDGTYDYFIRTDGSNITDVPTAGTEEGTYYFSAQDMNAPGCPAIASGAATLLFDDIDIAGCSGLSFQALVAHVSVFSGWDNAEFMHIDYDIDNSGTWSNLLWFENNGTGINQIALQDTDFDGVGDGTVLNAGFQNFTAAIAGTGNTIDIRVTIQMQDAGADVCIDNLRIFGTGCTGPSTITTGAVSAGPYSSDCGNDSGTSGTIAFTSFGTYNAGNSFTLQLSDAAGSFATPTVVGTLSGASAEGSNPSSNINFTLPSDLTTGSGYIFRIVSSDPNVISDLTSAFTITESNPCGITAGAMSGGPYSSDCGNATGTAGSIAFTSAGTFNSGNTFTVQLSDASGSFASPINIGSLSGAAAEGLSPSSSINYTIPSDLITGSGYLIQIISSDFVSTSDLTSVFTITQSNPCGVTTGVITGGPFTVDCVGNLTDAGSVAFTSSGAFNAGNTYTVQLSNAAGSFASPTNIGSISSTANSGNIPITIPVGLVTSSAYLIRIVSSNDPYTGSQSSSFTITQADPCSVVVPHLTSVIINSCGTGTCVEANNEMIFGNTGSYSVEMTSTNFEMTYGSTASPTTTYTSPLTTNTVTTALLNTAAGSGCAGTFVEGTGVTLPPNASYLLVSDNLCTDALDWSSLCGTGPIYVIYTNDGSWASTGGNFGNGNASTPSGTIRYFETTIIDTDGNSYTVDYSYDVADLDSHADGDYILFDDDGGVASTYGNNGCTIDPVVLSSDVINFMGDIVNDEVLLKWSSTSELNNDYYSIYHSIDGYDWSHIGDTPGAGTSITELYYGMIHERPEPGLNYYQLHSTDFDGTTYTKSTIAVKTDINFAYYNILNGSIELKEETDLEIYSTDGRLVYKNAEAKSVFIETKGMFILVDLKTNQTERIMVH